MRGYKFPGRGNLRACLCAIRCRQDYLCQQPTHLLPEVFFKPRLYPEKSDSIDIVSLREIEEQHKKSDQTKSSKILPIIIDHRESDAPNSQEISVLKRFLRTSDIKCIILWLTTNRKLANQMAEMIEEIAGLSPIELPLIFLGPPHSEWQDITLNTMIISNGIQDIADLGINPKDYSVDKSRTIGEFIRNISNEFNKNRLRLIRETRKPISLIVVFVTNSQDPGILGSLTNSNKYGLIEGQALLQSSPNSEVGRWWKERVSLLTRTILQLNARMTFISPTASVNALRTYLDDETSEKLTNSRIERKNPSTIARDLARTDFYKHIVGKQVGAFENRGSPPEKSVAAFKSISEARGFTYGKDKTYNAAIAKSLEDTFRIEKHTYINMRVEQKLHETIPLIPDTYIETEEVYTCIEYAWRKGDFLTKSNRSSIAQYALEKLRSYATELGWVSK